MDRTAYHAKAPCVGRPKLAKRRPGELSASMSASATPARAIGRNAVRRQTQSVEEVSRWCGLPGYRTAKSLRARPGLGGHGPVPPGPVSVVLSRNPCGSRQRAGLSLSSRKCLRSLDVGVGNHEISHQAGQLAVTRNELAQGPPSCAKVIEFLDRHAVGIIGTPEIEELRV